MWRSLTTNGILATWAISREIGNVVSIFMISLENRPGPLRIRTDPLPEIEIQQRNQIAGIQLPGYESSQ